MILKLFDVLEHLESQGPQKPLITNQEYVNSYTLVYHMCTQRSPSNYSQQVYERHDEILKNYSKTKVLKSLQEKTGVHMLKEVGRRWGHHQQLDSWMKRFLQYIDRYFVSHHNLPTLQETCEWKGGGVGSFFSLFLFAAGQVGYAAEWGGALNSTTAHAGGGGTLPPNFFPFLSPSLTHSLSFPPYCPASPSTPPPQPGASSRPWCTTPSR